MTFPHEPYRTSGPAGDRTWRQSTANRLQWLAVPLIMTVVSVGLLQSFRTTFTGWAGYFVWAVGALFVLSLASTLRDTLRSAHRVTLRPDGTLELARAIGTVRVRVDRVRAMRVPRFDNDRTHGMPIRLLTDDGTYRVHRGIEDLDGFVEALSRCNPRIELPGL